jgi:hypothetical protein
MPPAGPAPAAAGLPGAAVGARAGRVSQQCNHVAGRHAWHLVCNPFPPGLQVSHLQGQVQQLQARLEQQQVAEPHASADPQKGESAAASPRRTATATTARLHGARLRPAPGKARLAGTPQEEQPREAWAEGGENARPPNGHEHSGVPFARCSCAIMRGGRCWVLLPAGFGQFSEQPC